MRLSWLYSIFLGGWLGACAVEQNIPIDGDFEISLADERHNVPVRVRITNRIKGADTFRWEFPEGSYTSSDAIHPEEIVYRSAKTHTITLHATNLDGEQKTFQKQFTAFAELTANFDWQQVGSQHAPLTLKMQNHSQGAKAYQWHFQGGTPEFSAEENPTVVFERGGDFKITLEVINHSQTEKMEKNISVAAALEVAFDWKNEYAENRQAPVRIFLKNNTQNATLGYHWQVKGDGFSQESTLENPDFLLPTAGNYQITLTAKNDKQTLALSKDFLVEQGQNLLTFTDVKLGIHAAQNSVGCAFSAYLEKVLTANEITPENGQLIDFVYFGQNPSFTYNVLLSPDKAQTTVFEPIANASTTQIVNKQENNAALLISAADFDALTSGSGLSAVSVVGQTNQAPFNLSELPRVVPFQTANGRKGAVKIKDFVQQGNESYLVADIKIQKIP